MSHVSSISLFTFGSFFCTGASPRGDKGDNPLYCFKPSLCMHILSLIPGDFDTEDANLLTVWRNSELI
jgi:hypothetical protein